MFRGGGAVPYLPVEGQIEVACDIEEFERRRERIQANLQAASQRASLAGVESLLLNRDGGSLVRMGLEAQRHDLLIAGQRKSPATHNDPPVSETMTEIFRHAPWPNVVGCQNIPRTSDVVNAYAGSVHSASTLQVKVHELPVGSRMAGILSHFVCHIPAGLTVMGIYGQPC